MKTLTFIRHAKSDWNNPELADYQRPLNKRGKKDAPDMGKRLRKYHIRPQLIFLSTAERTKETIKLIKESASWEKVTVIEKEWLYLASMPEYLKYIEKLHDEFDHVCFCGHNPTITGVVNYLTGETISNIPTCGVAVIEFEIESWKHLSESSGKLSHFDYPKNL